MYFLGEETMKKIGKIYGFILTFVLMFSVCVSNVSASETSEISTGADAISELQITNIQMTQVDEGYECTFDLVQEVQSDSENSTRSIGWVVAGAGRFRLTLLPGNGMGYADGSFTLTNGDVIKGVKGTLIIEKDILGPINPNYAKLKVNESYLGTLYKTANGSESFDFPESTSSEQNIIFRWNGFYVYGVEETYSVTNGNVQGKVSDF